MKKIILFATVAFIGTGSLQAQSTKAENKNTKNSTDKKGDRYCCPKHDYCNTSLVLCPAHDLALIKTGNYYCENCYTTCESACKCPVCGKEMVQMEDTKNKETTSAPGE